MKKNLLINGKGIKIYHLMNKRSGEIQFRSREEWINKMNIDPLEIPQEWDSNSPFIRNLEEIDDNGFPKFNGDGSSPLLSNPDPIRDLLFSMMDNYQYIFPHGGNHPEGELIQRSLYLPQGNQSLIINIIRSLFIHYDFNEESNLMILKGYSERISLFIRWMGFKDIEYRILPS